MDYKVFFTVFFSVLIAELGDKTQLATMLFATDHKVSKLTIFLGASMALALASGIGVLFGGVILNIQEKRICTISPELALFA